MRDDLQGLSEQALIELTNRGLVKRALREIDSGSGPELSLEPDGTVIGRARSSIHTRNARARPCAVS